MLKIQNLLLTSSFFYLYLSTYCLAKTPEFSEYTLGKTTINIISQRQTETEEELESPDIFSPNPPRKHSTRSTITKPPYY